MTAYYNEIEPYAAQWIRNLCEAGHVAPGLVDTRSIAVLTPDDVRATVQAHYFAGIAVWSAALRAAGWPDDAEVWTGSCPCQPFSSAGKKKGFADERHLWPTWFKLIRECRPPVIFGEQVASPDGLAWFDAVQTDLEAAGYAVGGVDLCAAGVGAPHIRQRLYFVAVTHGERLEGVRLRLRERRSRSSGIETARSSSSSSIPDTRGSDHRSAAGSNGGLAVAEFDGGGSWWNGESCGRSQIESDRHSDVRGMADLTEKRWRQGDEDRRRSEPRNLGSVERSRPTDDGHALERRNHADGLVDAGGEGSGGNTRAVHCTEGESDRARRELGRVLDVSVPSGPTRGYWYPAEWAACRDGKARPIEPRSFPLAYGARSRVGRLRATGNAIVRPLAQVFVEATIAHLVEGEAIENFDW